MARDFNDYDELLKNFDSKNSSRDISSNSKGSNDVYFNKQVNSEPKRKQNPNSPFYRDPEKDLPTPRNLDSGNLERNRSFKGGFHKSKADAYLDELDRAEVNKRNRYEKENKRYNGEVYFSNPPQEIREEAERQKRANSKSPYGKYLRNSNGDRMASSPVAKSSQRTARDTQKQRQKNKIPDLTAKDKLLKLAMYFLIVAVSSLIICIYGIGCINDVLAIDKRGTECEITISAGATDSDVINILKENKLIKNKGFCKLFIKVFQDKGEYVSGSYTINSDWGIEKMLSTMQAGNTYYETITLTFPEGYTIDQIAEKLESNKVCTASSFIKTMQSVDFSTEYAFLNGQADKELRFRTLEGYIYPDTYEFYVGENASSVVRRFLDNFESKWTADYTKQAKKLGMSVDEVVTLASIIQAEAADSSQMKDISSVLHNRLDKPGTFPRLECDSTEKYLIETIKATLTSSTTDTQKYIAYRDLYDTYSTDCKGLPVGSICNPGSAAINAALYPSDTDYNYFRHDKKGNVYYAETFNEHNQNGYKAAAIDD